MEKAKGVAIIMLALALALASAPAAQQSNVQTIGPCKGGTVGTEKISLRLPVTEGQYWLSSPYGMRVNPGRIRTMHMGLDLACVRKTSVHAAADGIVLFAGTWGSFGKVVILGHPGNVTTLYAHLAEIDRDLRPGVFVRRGQVIALSGATGKVRGANGAHLHWEVRVDGKYVNPALVCAGATANAWRKL